MAFKTGFYLFAAEMLLCGLVLNSNVYAESFDSDSSPKKAKVMDREILQVITDACDGMSDVCLTPKVAKSCSIAGGYYFRGELVKKNHERAFGLFNTGCNCEDPDSCTYLGWYYEEGLVYPQDLKKAFILYEKACADGSAIACGNAGNMYRFGKAVEVDYLKADEYYKRGCLLGSDTVCSAMGSLYLSGKIKGMGEKDAMAIFKKLCDKNFAETCAMIGHIYVYGVGKIKHDYDQALSHYQKGCNLGYTHSCEFHKILKDFLKQTAVYRQEYGKDINESAYRDFKKNLNRILWSNACTIGDERSCRNLLSFYKQVCDRNKSCDELDVKIIRNLENLTNTKDTPGEDPGQKE